MHFSSLILSGLLATGPAPASPSGPTLQATTGQTAIVGARLEIGDGRMIENGTIVLRGDRIVAVGAGLPAPAGAKTIDGKGLTVYPGFIDAYSTGGLKLPDPTGNVGPAPNFTDTAPATMWIGNRKGIRADVRAATSLDPKANFATRTAQGVTSVLLSGGNGSIAGTAALFELTPTPTALQPDAAVEFVIRGSGFGGGDEHDEHANDTSGTQTQQPGPPPNTVPPGGVPTQPAQNRPSQASTAPQTYNYPGTLFGITALVRQTLYDAKQYAGEKEPTKDATYEGLRPLVTGRVPAMFTIANAREIARVARIADEFGFRFIVNGAADAYRMVDLLRRRTTPVLVSLDLSDAPVKLDVTPERVYEDQMAQYRAKMQNARLLDEAGIPIAFRTAGGSSNYLSAVRQLAKLSGLPREATLRAMTAGPARIFGVDGQVGTLEVGKRANLVLMTGDFLDEKSTVQTTFVAGIPTEAAKKEAN